jgi:hypothetical protein
MASSPRDVVRMHRRDGFGRLRESALRRVLLTIRGHLTEAGAAVIDARQQPRTPVNGRRNLRSRAGKTERHERRVRVLRPALHAHVACLRCMRRWANGLTCSQVGMSERRAGQRPKGQARCRSHREDSLPHRLAPSVNDTCIRLCTPSGAFRQPSALRTAGRPVGCRHGWRTSCTARRRTPRSSVFGAQPALTTRGAARSAGSRVAHGWPAPEADEGLAAALCGPARSGAACWCPGHGVSRPVGGRREHGRVSWDCRIWRRLDRRGMVPTAGGRAVWLWPRIRACVSTSGKSPRLAGFAKGDPR